MEKLSRKELKEQYKNRVVIGGVYSIKCDATGRTWIKSTKDMESAKRRFEFMIETNMCPEMSMNPEWNQYGSKTFSFAVLEELKKGETQTEREFSDDIDALLEMWIENQNSNI
ncbi:GIY-YIG nuclease family protein [Anaerocolumna sp.]|uniref:GIY-YIG nuclease family protein n=1 Tax=Anaerocolumna sp. TaxID=2041569 RepID=UPI0028A67341|nr:GIY-YIG nuclease family protein [Anaerocolumna sp.]